MRQAAPRPASATGRLRLVPVVALAFLVGACAGGGSEIARPGAASIAIDDRTAESASTAGAYLAGRHADRVRDVQRASRYMDRVLASGDVGIALKRRAFLLRLEDGRYDAAAELAPDIVDTLDENAPVASIFLSVEAARAGDFDRAATLIDQLPDSRLNRILRPLLDGWIALGRGDRAAAEAAMDRVLELDGFAILHALHVALAADAAGDTDLAAERYAKAVSTVADPPLRIRLTAADFHARRGDLDRALMIALSDSSGAADPTDVRRALTKTAETRAGQRPSVTEGLAQAFFDLGSALQRDRRTELGMVFSRLALRLDPEFDLAILLVAEILDDRGQHAEALALYDDLPAESAYRLMADLRAISSLEDMDRIDEAVGRLEALAVARADLTDPLVRLGDLYRSRERWDEAVAAYDRAFARVPADQAAPWSLYYSRGIALERSARWDRAEADFLAALEIRPEQPYVLNYLGYTWIDQGRHLPRATKMIEQAVALRPNDGYIVDSLGWAMFRQGRFEEAVTHLERAVELRPTDPTINDHLGDAYWRVDRRQEARFQWRRALSFGPDGDLAAAIEQKLQAGLPALEPRTVKTAGAEADAEG